MEGVMIKDDDWRDGLGVKLFNLQQTGQFCDVIIKTIEDARLLVHSCILAAASPLLKGVIESALSDSSLGTIMLSSDIDLATWNHMLEFMYMGSTSVEVNLLPSLSNGASILKIDTLVNKCNEVIVEKPAQIEQEPIVEPPPETADTELYPVIAQIKEDSDHGMDTEDYAIDVQEAPATPDYIIVPNMAVSTGKDNTEDGYQAALDFLLASNVQAATLKAEPIQTETNDDPTSTKKKAYAEAQVLIKDTEFELIGYTPKGKKQYRCCLCSTLCLDPTVHRLVHSEERPFVCEINTCGKAYKSKPALKQHILSNHSKYVPHRCIKCGKCFKTEYLLKKHVTITCNDSRPYVCRTCGKRFKTISNLRYHEGTHATIKPFKCSICYKDMATKAHLKVHMISHDNGNYNCFCGKTFKSSKRYKEHFKYLHDPQNPNRCNICERNFKNAAALEYHKPTHDRPFACRVCKKGFTKAISCHIHEKSRHRIDVPEGCENSGKSMCPVCNKEYKTVQSMLMHMEMHSLEDNFECVSCHKKFKLKKQLQSHMLSHIEPHVPCPKCEKKFKNGKALSIHLASHSKPFECDMCRAKFSCEKYLEKHKEYHKTGLNLKTYLCPVCKVSFPFFKDAEEHISKQHDDWMVDNKITLAPIIQQGSSDHASQPRKAFRGNFNCEICTAVFQYESSLITHEIRKHDKLNSRVACDQCDVKFLTPRTLKQHLYYEHNIGERVICRRCEREFFSKADLTKHEVVHGGQGGDSSEEGVVGQLSSEKKRLHVCIVCTKYLASHELLAEHEHSHSKADLVCKICGKESIHLKDYKEHARVCSTTQCTYCCQKFSSKAELEKHKDFHKLGKVIYKCSICSEEFKSLIQLQTHKKLHTEEFSSKDLPVVSQKGKETSGYKSLLSAFSSTKK